MIINQYSYLIATLFFGVIWLIFFLHAKKFRKEIITMSILFGFGGLASQLIHKADWWDPLRITNTPIGLEDFLFGFFIGGILSVAYNIFYKEKYKEKKISPSKLKLIKIIFIFTSILIILFLFGFNSFFSSTIGFIISLSIIYTQRKDLIKNSLITGVAGIIIMFPIYQIILFLTPSFFITFWKFEIFGKILLFKIPLEEYIWYFLAGAFIGPLYEYWKEVKLIK